MFLTVLFGVTHDRANENPAEERDSRPKDHVEGQCPMNILVKYSASSGQGVAIVVAFVYFPRQPELQAVPLHQVAVHLLVLVAYCHSDGTLEIK